MNNKQGTLIFEWLNPSANRTDISTADFKQENNMEEDGLSKEAAFIISGVKNEISEFGIGSEYLTINSKNNEKEEGKNTAFSLLNSKQLKQNEIKKSLETVSSYKKNLKESTFYKHIRLYNGVIQSIDEESDTFTAHLINQEENDDEMIAEFNFKDLSFPSDTELIREGALFVWIWGKEVKHGTETHISRLIFRRTRVIRKKELQEIKENAKKWAEFFNGIGDTETAEK